MGVGSGHRTEVSVEINDADLLGVEAGTNAYAVPITRPFDRDAVVDDNTPRSARVAHHDPEPEVSLPVGLTNITAEGCALTETTGKTVRKLVRSSVERSSVRVIFFIRFRRRQMWSRES